MLLPVPASRSEMAAQAFARIRDITSKALGPRAGQCQHPVRGPSAFPVPAPQFKR